MELEDGEVESVELVPLREPDALPDTLADCELESLLELLLEGDVLYIPALELLELGEAVDD